MTKLNQIIAVANGKKTKTTELVTEVYKRVQKPELFQGFSRTYNPSEEDGETKPPENKLVQYFVDEAVKEFTSAITELIDVVLTQDTANCSAKSNIEIDGTVLAKDVPVTHLLFLEKQVTDIRTFITKLPVLDPSEDWRYDSTKDCFITNPTKTNATKKVLRNHVKAEATEKHCAQVDTFTEDVKVGEWSVVKFSGAIPAKKKKELTEKIEKLLEAIKFAREQANSMEISQAKIGENLLSFIFK